VTAAQHSRPGPRIVDIVFGVARTPRRSGLVLGLLFALCAHGALLLWAQSSEQSLESWSAEVALRIHAELSRDETVELEKPPVPPPPPPEAPAPLPAPKTVAPRAASPRSEPAAPQPPAQAAAIVAAETDPSAPVDLSSETFVTGTASAYAGGVTTARGKSTVAVRTLAGSPSAPSKPRATAPDRSSSVALEAQDWSCPWPREAIDEPIDEQVVIVRVVVRPDGSAESASITQDRVGGFGRAAIACALRTRFIAGRDRTGRPTKALSPPIRVRFTR
jgi:protein TonB